MRSALVSAATYQLTVHTNIAVIIHFINLYNVNKYNLIKTHVSLIINHVYL